MATAQNETHVLHAPALPATPHHRVAKTRRAFTGKGLFQLGVVITLIWFGVALLAPWIAPHNPFQGEAALANGGLSLAHPFGLDKYGRDVLSRVIYGSRYDLFMALAVVLFAILAGTLIGSVSGFIGGKVDSAIMRLVDMVLAFPSFVLALVFVAVFSPTLTTLIVALGIRFIPIYARLTRGEILVEKVKEYAVAARALGCSHPRLIFRHLLPNILAPIITQSTMNMAWAILNAAGLSFLGLGIQPPIPEWGVMISEGSPYIVSGQWWMSLFPGAALIVMTAGFVLVGDGLNAQTQTMQS
jgi:peptide/nickel transport system permease protein